MNQYLHGWALVLLMMACAGCTSVPVHYYTLATPEGAVEPADKLRAIPIDVRVVHMPALLNRSELIVRSGPTEVTLLENERWASPLDDEIRDAVRYELQKRFAQVPDSAPWRSLTQLAITIDVERIETEPGRYALVEVAWGASTKGAVKVPHDTAIQHHPFRGYEQIGDGYNEIVAGYQRAIQALADSIISVLSS